MTSRTKEALIAQHEIKKRKTKFSRFSLKATPDSSTLMIAVIGIALMVIPFIIPDVGKGIYSSRILSAVRGQELGPPAFPGQFREASHVGATKPNPDATFWGVSLLKEKGYNLAHEAQTKEYVIQREKAQFGNNSKQIYQGIVELLSLQGQSAISHVDKYYKYLLNELAEKFSGFRLNPTTTSSIEGTYYAFEAISKLNKFEDFRKQDAFSSAIGFVVSMKDDVTKGFKNQAGENATLVSTWQAISILSHASSESASTALDGVDRFVFSCQAKDGGFLNKPIESPEDLYYTHSTSANTAQGLYILESLRNRGQKVEGVYYDAVSYLRATLCLSSGIVRSYPGDGIDLEGAYYFFKLVDKFSVSYGIPRSFQLSLVGVGVLVVLSAVYFHLRAQLPRGATRELRSTVIYTTAFLVAGAVAVTFCPQIAVLVYLAFAVYLAIQLYEVSAADYTEGLLTIVAASHAFAFMVLVVIFLLVSPVIFANLRFFYVLGVWGAISSFVVTWISCYSSGVSKFSFFVQSGYAGWIAKLVLFYSFLYGRGEMDVFYRLIVIHGHFPLVFVVLPLVLLLTSYALSAYGAYNYFEWKDSENKEAEEKEEKSKDEKSKDEQPGSAKDDAK